MVVAFTHPRHARSQAVMGQLGMRFVGDIHYAGLPEARCELDRA